LSGEESAFLPSLKGLSFLSSPTHGLRHGLFKFRRCAARSDQPSVPQVFLKADG